MDKKKFFASAGFRTETFKSNGTKFTIRELSLAERRAVLGASEQNYPAEVIAAYTIALSCPEFTEDDVERLIESVRPEILLAASAKIYELSGMMGDAKSTAKKPLERTRKSYFRFGWRWPWEKQLRS